MVKLDGENLILRLFMNTFCSNAGWFGLTAIAINIFLLGYICGYKPTIMFYLDYLDEIENKK